MPLALVLCLLGGVAMSSSGAVLFQTAPGFDHKHSLFAELLGRHVRDGRVDYPGVMRERALLERYLQALNQVDAAALAGFSREQQLAYWINAYNAFVLATIADRYPIKRGSLVGLLFPANSIWQISGAFKKQRFTAGGRRVSLDDIEHRIIRPTFREPRIHMALVCAAKSCPDLRSTPYLAAELNTQLDAQTLSFLSNVKKGMRLEMARGEVALSSIFKWFDKDFAAFAPGGKAEAGVLEFAARHEADAGRAATLRSGKLRVRYLDYDWTLNE